MFTRVLIAEDHQSLKRYIEQLLLDLGVTFTRYAYDGDFALQQLRQALKEDAPFELLVTDLSFTDAEHPNIKNGMQLVEAARQLQPELKVLVFSIESNPGVVRDLFLRYHIDGFVKKGRNDAVELDEALQALAEHKKYIPSEFRQAVRDKNAYDFSDYDLMIVSQLAQGVMQKNIPDYLKKMGMKAPSLRSVEKQLGVMRNTFGFATNEQLIAYCKDRKII